MNLLDQLFKEYFSIPKIFANIFNTFCLEDKKALDPDKLEKLEIWDCPWLNLYSQYDFAEAYAPAFENAVLMSDGRALCLLIVVGSQDRYFYLTPLAAATFDIDYLAYQFSGGFYRADKPYYTAIIYLGTDDWTAPITFQELTDEEPGQDENVFFNYKIPLLQPSRVNNNTLNEFCCKSFQDMTNLVRNGNESLLVAFLKKEILSWGSRQPNFLGPAQLLCDRNIFSAILKSALKEYKDLDLAKIAAKYVGDTLESEIVPSEQGPEYAFQFSAISPETYEKSIVHITVLTGEYDPEYPLVQRGIFEASELISKQYVNPARPEEKIQKVYSIWILKEALRGDRAGSIVCYDVQGNNISSSGKLLSQSSDENGLISILVFSLDKPGTPVPEHAEILAALAILLDECGNPAYQPGQTLP